MSNLASLASCNGLAQWRNFRSNARKLPTKCGPNVHKSGRKSHKRILDIGRDPSVSVFSSDYRRRHNNPSFCHVGENINRHGDHRLALITPCRGGKPLGCRTLSLERGSLCCLLTEGEVINTPWPDPMCAKGIK